ncbi:hypothetical protein DB346_11930 [Verrucomicrobia bacterium LW23]|nr:hypothetical protein DB346_11930 [Verrucomicrobia bacterium LW23]
MMKPSVVALSALLALHSSALMAEDKPAAGAAPTSREAAAARSKEEAARENESAAASPTSDKTVDKDKDKDKNASPAPATAKRDTAPREEMAEITFLGVAAVPVPPALAAHLKLQPGFGLLVGKVAEGSPAATARLQENDVLVKLDDQKLIEPRQLLVLVRSLKANDEITLTYIRAGDTLTTKVRVASKSVPRSLLAEESGNLHDRRILMSRPAFHGQVPTVVPLPPAGSAQPWTAPAPTPTPTPSAVRLMPPPAMGTFHTMLREGDIRCELQSEDGKNVFIVRDAAGKELFRSSLESKDDRDKVPEAYRDYLKRMEAIRARLSVPPPPSPTAPVAPQPVSLLDVQEEEDDDDAPLAGPAM